MVVDGDSCDALPGRAFALMAELLDGGVLQDMRELIEFVGSECGAVPAGRVG